MQSVGWRVGAFWVASSALVAQCLLYPVSLPERVAESGLIVEGQLVRSWVVRDDSRHMLYTVWELEVTKHIAGILPGDRLRIAHEGGIDGGWAVDVSPAAPLADGLVGLFFVRQAPQLRAIAGNVYTLVAGPQGVFVYDLWAQSAADPFTAYKLPQLYRALESLTGQSIRTYRPLPQPSPKGAPIRPLATITSFTPSTISAGTFDTLRILGAGFGSTPGSVRFRNPDDGGSSWVSVPSDHIVFWSDTEIRVLVPTRAGTGPFQVVTSVNEVVTSPSAVTIPYALLTLSSGGVRYPIRLVNHNGTGGYTLVPNATFAANTAAYQAAVRALQTWRCGTYVNIALSGNTTSIGCAADDGVNVLSFDSDACALPSGVLGATYNYYQSCTAGGQQYWRRSGFDLIFRRTAPGGGWNFGPQLPSSTQYDFESVVLHELGHAHLLGHIIAAGELMHYAIGPGIAIRALGQSTDQAGGARVMQLSTVSAPCGPGAMTPLTADNCIVGRPVANFTAQPREGCAPLAVSFTDSSVGASSWAWDVDGNGSVDYTTRNCVHTYSQPGQYTVRLVVSNTYGSDTLVRSNYITVYPVPAADAGPDRTVCPGESVRLGGSPTAAAGTPPYQYSWEPTEGLDNPASANPTARLETSRQYVVTVTDARGCHARDTVTVVVRPRPEPYLSIVGSTEFCDGDSVRLVAPWSYRRYRWSTGDTVRALVVRRGGSYWVEVQDSLGCWGRSDTVVVRVYALPQAQITGTSQACVGDTLLYRAAAPQPGDWFEWTVQGGTLLRGQHTPEVWVRWTEPGMGRLLLRQRSQQGCEGISSPFAVAVAPVPEPAVTVLGPTAFCEGDSTVLEAPAGYVRYRWVTGDTTRRLVVRQAGTYTVEVITAAGCRGISQPVEIQTYPLPPKPVMERRGDTLFCVTEAVAYRWYLDGQLLLGATARAIVVRRSGSYAVEITDSNGCRNVSDPVDVTVGLTDGAQWLSPCMPTPAEDVLWVELPDGGLSRIVLSDMLGRVLWEGLPGGGQGRVAIPLRGLPAGFYLLRLSARQATVWCYILKR